MDEQVPEDDFAALIASAERFLATATGTSPYTVKMTQWERKLYTETRTSHYPLSTAHASMVEDIDYAEELLTDVFAYLWLSNPSILSRRDVLPTRWDNHKVLRAMQASMEVQTLRTATVHDETASAMAITWLADSIRAWLGLQEEDVEVEVASGAVADALKALREDLADGEDPSEAAQALADALQEAGMEQEEDTEFIQGLDGAAERASDRFNELSQLGAMIGLSTRGSSRGDGQKLSTAQTWQALERLSHTGLKQYADLIGRFIATATKGITPTAVPKGVELSDRVQDADAGELATRRHRLLRLEHLERVASGELITDKYTGKADKAGPLVVVVDESASMKWAYDADNKPLAVTPKTWSKAFTLAMHAQAKASKRRFVIISFSSTNLQKTWVDPVGAELVEYLQHFYSGETAYEEALDLALEVVESYPGMRAADIVLVTDDDRPDVPAQWHTRWSQRRAEVKPVPPRLRGVGVSDQTGSWLSKVTDDVVMITDFTSQEQVARAAQTF